MFFRYFYIGCWVLIGFLSLIFPAFAAGSGGYRLEVAGAAASGKGLAFTGEANDPTAVYFNPAGMAQLVGNSLTLGVSLVQPKADYESGDGQVKAKMERGTFYIPHAFFVTDLGTRRFALGLGAMSSWGLVTEWPQDSFARYSTTRAEVSNKDYLITASYLVTDQFSLALGVDIDDSFVDKQKKLYQGGGDGNFRLRGRDLSPGYRFAAMYKMNDRHQFGLVYRSAIFHKYRGKIYMDDLNSNAALDLNGDSTPESSFQGVFGGSSYSTEVEAKSTLPDSVVIGYSYRPNAKWVFNADLEWMNWSVVDDEEVSYPSETDPIRRAILNTGNPAPRDWASVISTAIGIQYNVSEIFCVRTGYFFHLTPIPGDTWEPNLPDSNSHGVTAGIGYAISRNMTLDLAWAGMYFMPRVIDNTVASGTINGTYEQWINLLYLSLSYKF